MASEADAFAKGLQDAISSGDWARVQPYFPRPGTPALVFMLARWREMRLKQLDPVAWDVSFHSFYMRSGKWGGRLSVAAREASGRSVGDHFDVELVHRGDGWVVGDDLPETQCDARVTGHNLRLEVANGTLDGLDELTLTRDGPDRRLFLTLRPGMALDRVTLGGRPWPAVQEGELLYVDVPQNDDHKLLLAWHGAVKGSPLVLDGRSAWYPRPLVETYASYTLTARVAGANEAAAVGKAVPAADGYRTWQTEALVTSQALVAGTFQKAAGDAAALRVNALMSPQADAALCTAVAGAAQDTAAFYQKHYGAAPSDDLVVVQADDLRGAPGLVPLSTAALAAPETAQEALDRGLARSWIDRVAYAGPERDRLFMTDGLSAYMALLHRADIAGPEAFRQVLGAAQQIVAPQPEPGSVEAIADAAASAPPKPVITDENRAMARSILVYQMLRHKVGNAAFDQALQALWQQPRTAPVDIHAFQQAFDQASGKHLGGFFAQWLADDGVPVLELAEVQVVKRNAQRYEITGVVVQHAPMYAFDLPVVVTTGKEPVLYSVPVHGERSIFRLVSRRQPRTLLVDPLHDTLSVPPDGLAFEEVKKKR